MGKIENKILEEDPNAFVANSRLKTKEIFKERSRYKDDVPMVASNGTELPYIDMWYDKSLYGRVNNRFQPVYPSETNLVLLADGCTVLDFVADAFNAFRKRWEELTAQGVVEQVGLLSTLQPIAGWVSVHEQYHMYVEEMYADLQEWLKTKRSTKMLNFSDFLKVFAEYVAEKAPAKTFTRSGYIASAQCDPRISGLIIEMNRPTVSFNNDYTKYRAFLTDPNYELYALTAAQYGFYVDKNAPFRLVANVKSQAMLGYMSKYGINRTGRMFALYYYRAMPKDRVSLMPYLVSMWNSYASSYPYYTVSELVEISTGQYVTKRKMYQRQLLTTDKPLPDLEEIKFMFYVNCKEASAPYSQNAFNHHVRNIERLWNSGNKSAVVEYLFDSLDEYPVPSPGGNPSPAIEVDNAGEMRYNTKGSTNNVGDFQLKLNWSKVAVSDS